MCFRPSSILFAISISPSRVRSSTDPISRMYMRTGSVVRPNSGSTVESAASASSSASSSGTPAGLAQFEELLRLKLELSLELLFLLLGKERRFLRFCLLQRGELLGFRLFARGEFSRLGFFARDALALPLPFSGGLEAQSFPCGPLARPLQLQGLARPVPLLCRLEPCTLLLFRGFRPRRNHGLARLILVSRRLRSGRLLRFHPAKPFFFLGGPGALELERFTRPQALFLPPQPLGGLGFLRPEPCGGFCARF